MNPSITRAKKAYAANNIPWDKALESLPAKTLDHLSNCWERRAAGMSVDEGFIDTQAVQRLAQREATRILRGGAGRYGAEAFERSQRQYHGYQPV